MAKSTSRPPKLPTPIDTSTPFDAPVSDMGAAEAPPPEQAEEPPAKLNGQHRPGLTTKTPTFIQTMNSVPKGDWGPRANIYLYRVEPVIDRTRSGDSKFINVYAEPVSEDRVMADYGSGRYKMILNFRKPGAATGDVIDSTYMDILNMKYPPKIPLGEWTDDPRNKKWAWAKEANGIPVAAPAPASSGLEAVVDVMRATSEMRRDIREEMQASAPLTPPAPPALPDPFDTAKKIMDMRGNDPMIAALMQRLDAADKAAERSRDREFELLRELRQTATKPVETTKGLVEQLLDVAANVEKLEPIKKLFGFTGGEVTGRAARTTGMDILNNLVSGPAGTMLAQGLGTLLVNLPRMFTPAEGAPGQGQPPTQPIVLPPPGAPPTQMPETPEQKLQRIGMTVTEPMLYEFFLRGATGDVWADRMNDLWPNDFAFVKSIGPDVLVNHYRQTRAWMLIAPKEAEFKQFMADFCAFDPNAESTEQSDDDTGIVDLEAEEN
jgi:hypothetical protein